MSYCLPVEAEILNGFLSISFKIMLITYSTICLKQDEWTIWPHFIMVGETTEVCKSSWQIGQFWREICSMHVWVVLMSMCKHKPHLSQWKNLSRPPVLQRPHFSQWNWPFSILSSNKLHLRHAYSPKLTSHFLHLFETFCLKLHWTQTTSFTANLASIYLKY